jgi:hypothetical protein
LKCVRLTFVAAKKQWVLHNLCVCVCSFRYPALNAHALCRMLPSPLYNIFPNYLINGTIFEKKCFEYKIVIRVYLQHLSEIYIILRRIEEIWSKLYIGLHVKYPLFLYDFNETNFLKILKYQTLWKSGQWEPRYFMRTDERTDMTKVLVAFRNSANSPKEETVHKNHKKFTHQFYRRRENCPFCILQMLWEVW